jgi:uncharacterized protein with von Willebrand factor type A (vWA) domain
VYNFSGPGQVVEQELSFEGPGLARMLGFVGASFGGGTEIDEPMRRACARIEEAPWQLADLAVVSDGCFGLGGHVRGRVIELKRKGPLRIHGIQVGTGPGFDEICCDTIHEVPSWSASAVGHVGS